MQDLRPPRCLVDFSNPAELERWLPTDDVVMGGRSSSGLLETPRRTALFTGTVSLARGGGFAAIRSAPFEPGNPELGRATALVLRVRGDGKRYKLRARTTEDPQSFSYLVPFDTESQTWQEVYLQASDFVPTWRGRVVSDAPPLSFAEIRSFGLLISDKQEGDFALELSWLACS